jgi:histidinol-phosphate aminotransferase
VEKLAQMKGLKPSQVLLGNGSDETLYLSFLAYCDRDTPAIFPDITYGFYKVFAESLNLPYVTIPLEEDFSIDHTAYLNCGKTVFIANPNAPTGQLLTLSQIKEIADSNPGNAVIIDEAYIDFGGESAISLLSQCENLLVTQTFSKSRSLAGGRLGMIFGSQAMISDLKTIKYSINPYNVNTVTQAAGLGALEDEDYTQANCQVIKENRSFTTEQLRSLGFAVTDSYANFVLAAHPAVSGGELYTKLKSRGILVRYFNTDRLRPFVRITIGTRQEMESLLGAVKEILEEA